MFNDGQKRPSTTTKSTETKTSSIINVSRNKRKSPITPKTAMDKDELTSPPQSQSKTTKSETANSPSNNASTNSQPTGARIGARVKKARIPFDPSSFNFPSHRRSRQPSTIITPTQNNNNNNNDNNIAASTPISNAVVPEWRVQKKEKDRKRYQLQKERNKQRKKEQELHKKKLSDTCVLCDSNEMTKKGDKLISCIDCGYKAHYFCVKRQNASFTIDEEPNWQCSECQLCFVCFESGILEQLFKCAFCMNSYHLKCHGTIPKLRGQQIKNKFRCKNCERFENEGPTSTIALQQSEEPERSIHQSDDQVLIKNEAELNDTKNVKEIELTNATNVLKIRANYGNNDFEIETKPQFIEYSAAINNGDGFDLSLSSGAGESQNSTNVVLNVDLPIQFQKTLTTSVIGSNMPITDSPRTERNSSQQTNSIDMQAKDSIINNNNNNNNNDGIALGAIDILSISNDSITDGRDIENIIIRRENVPDASNWSFEEVFNYFIKYFPNSAHIFKDQEIDGPCLLLMKRSDILDGFNLTLGAALQIYSHITMLQTRNNDPRLTWM